MMAVLLRCLTSDHIMGLRFGEGGSLESFGWCATDHLNSVVLSFLRFESQCVECPLFGIVLLLEPTGVGFELSEVGHLLLMVGHVGVGGVGAVDHDPHVHATQGVCLLR